MIGAFKDKFGILVNMDDVFSSINSQERPFICKVCHKEILTVGKLALHLCTHTKEKEFLCSSALTVCFSEKDDYHESFIYKKEFTTSSNIKVHFRIRTGEKPYACNICNKSFSSSSVLQVHYRSHTGEKPFVCSVCYKKFSGSSHLKDHHRHFHTEGKMFACNICKKVFTTKSN